MTYQILSPSPDEKAPGLLLATYKQGGGCDVIEVETEIDASGIVAWMNQIAAGGRRNWKVSDE